MERACHWLSLFCWVSCELSEEQQTQTRFFLLSFFEFFFFVKQVETRRDRKGEMIIPTIAVKMLLIIISTLHIGVLIISIKIFGKVVSGQVLSCPI